MCLPPPHACYEVVRRACPEIRLTLSERALYHYCPIVLPLVRKCSHSVGFTGAIMGWTVPNLPQFPKFPRVAPSAPWYPKAVPVSSLIYMLCGCCCSLLQFTTVEVCKQRQHGLLLTMCHQQTTHAACTLWHAHHGHITGHSSLHQPAPATLPHKTWRAMK
jgi:hypothetical protein